MNPCIRFGSLYYTEFIAAVGRPELIERDGANVRLRLETQNLLVAGRFTSRGRCGEYKDWAEQDDFEEKYAEVILT